MNSRTNWRVELKTRVPGIFFCLYLLCHFRMTALKFLHDLQHVLKMTATIIQIYCCIFFTSNEVVNAAFLSLPIH